MQDSGITNIGIIGYGYWGPNLLRNFSNVDRCNVATVVDLREDRLKPAQKTYPAIKFSSDPNEIFNNPEIDAVVIATPVFTHFDLARKALEMGKHVLLEKPMADTVAHVDALIDLAAKKNKTLMVDHTFLYNSAVKKMKELVDNGDLGHIRYFDSTRINLGLIQPDINVLWDLAPHDISILNYLVPERPYSVQATGISHIHGGIENIAYLTVNYANGIIAHFSCSWSSPVKIRMMLVGGDKKMIVYNDMEHAEKIKVYDSGYQVQNDEEKSFVQVAYRTGDIYVPKLDLSEALFVMANDFINAIQKGTTPISDCQSGLWTIKILEAGQKSIKNKGVEVVL